jgi:preprotein translocase subunit SecE
MEQNTPRVGLIGRIRNYFDEVKTEGKRVTWPSKEDVKGGGIVLLVVLIGLSVILGSMDVVFGYIVEILFT